VKKVRHNHKQAGRFITVKLENVTRHARYDTYNEILTLIDYVMTASNSMTDLALSTCLTIHPIVVVAVTGKEKKYVCVAGLRSLLLAKSIFGLNAETQAVLLEQSSHEIIDLMVSADVLFTHLLFSIKKPDALGKIFNIVPAEHLSSLLVESARSKAGFTEQTSYVYNSLFPPSQSK